METQVRFVFDADASRLMAHAFASGLVDVVSHNPKFAIRDFSGEARFSADTLTQASMRVTIKASSLELLDEVSEYDQHVVRRVTMDEVLKVKSFPEIVFESSQVTALRIKENLFRATVAGNLMLHGVSRAHSFNAQVVVGENSLRAYGDFSIKQTDFGVDIASSAGRMLKMKDEVKIAFFIIARKEALASSRKGRDSTAGSRAVTRRENLAS